MNAFTVRSKYLVSDLSCTLCSSKGLWNSIPWQHATNERESASTICPLKVEPQCLLLADDELWRNSSSRMKNKSLVFLDSSYGGWDSAGPIPRQHVCILRRVEIPVACGSGATSNTPPWKSRSELTICPSLTAILNLVWRQCRWLKTIIEAG